MRKFDAVGGIDFPADFHLQMLEAGAKVRFEQIIEHLTPLPFRIFDQQPR